MSRATHRDPHAEPAPDCPPIVDRFRGQHGGIAARVVETAAGRVRVAVDDAESPLAWLARRKGKNGRPMIEPHQLLAGERLREQFTRAQMMPRTTANLSGAAGIGRHMRGTGDVAEVVVAVRQQVRRALAATGPELAGVLLDICCFLKGLEDVERERDWPPRSAKVMLQCGLNYLARHYGLSIQATGPARGAIRAWQAADGE